MPDAVLMDLRMPELDGIETMRRAQAQCAPHPLPVLIITASGLPHERTALQAAGAAGYVSKPIRESQLFDELQRVLNLSFVYAPENVQPAAAAATVSDEDLIRVLATLESCRRQELCRAVQRGEIDKVRQILSASAVLQQPAVAGHLRELAERYAYEKILRLAEAAEKEVT